MLKIIVTTVIGTASVTLMHIYPGHDFAGWFSGYLLGAFVGVSQK